jgi:hypothetical protein
MLTKDALRSLIFVVLTFGVLWALVEKKVQKINYVIIALVVLVLVDMWGVDKRYLNDNNFVDKKKAFAILPTEADMLILQYNDPNFRVFNAASNTFN